MGNADFTHRAQSKDRSAKPWWVISIIVLIVLAIIGIVLFVMTSSTPGR